MPKLYGLNIARIDIFLLHYRKRNASVGDEGVDCKIFTLVKLQSVSVA